MYINYKIFNDPNFQFVRHLMENADYELSYLSMCKNKNTTLEEWKCISRNYIFKQMSYNPERVDLNPEIVEEIKFDGYTRKKVYYNSEKDRRVSAYLLVPDNIKDKVPGVMVMHDHGAMFYWGKEKSVEHKSYHPTLKKHIDGGYDGKPTASELAKNGYIALVPDCLYFGERRWELRNEPALLERLNKYEFESEEYILAYNRMEQEIEGEVMRAIQNAGYNYMGFRMKDEIVSLDYLCGLPEVDENRIGCIGLSMGGHRTGWLSALDDRIKCAVVVGFLFRYSVMIEQRLTNAPWMWHIPELYKKMDYPHIVSLAAPSPLMIIHGLKDTLFPDNTAEEAIEMIREVYEKSGYPDNFTFRIFDGPHELNTEMFGEALKWLNLNLIEK